MLQVYIVLVTLICCMIPFFGDFAALVGAIGFTPLVRTCCTHVLEYFIGTHLEFRACLFMSMSRYLPGLTCPNVVEFLPVQVGDFSTGRQHRIVAATSVLVPSQLISVFSASQQSHHIANECGIDTLQYIQTRPISPYSNGYGAQDP